MQFLNLLNSHYKSLKIRTMNTKNVVDKIQEEIIDDICRIKDTTDLLPHTVYVEEVNDDGDPQYKAYLLTKLLSGVDANFPSVSRSCILLNLKTGEEEQHYLSEICLDWLVTIWEHYEEVQVKKLSQQPSVFIYPKKRFEHNVSDEEIVSAFYDDVSDIHPHIRRLTLAEFADEINEGGFDGCSFWVRFIED